MYISKLIMLPLHGIEVPDSIYSESKKQRFAEALDTMTHLSGQAINNNHFRNKEVKLIHKLPETCSILDLEEECLGLLDIPLVRKELSHSMLVVKTKKTLVNRRHFVLEQIHHCCIQGKDCFQSL